MRLAVAAAAGMACGWLGGIVTRGSGFGLWGNMLTAMIGALGAVYLMGYFGIGAGDRPIFIAAIATIGAFITLAAIGRLRR